MAEPRPKTLRPEEIEQRRKAQEMSARTGVPLWGAFRVVRGEVSLNDLLKSLLRREKFQKLQAKDGLDADLAGHVASGTLPLWRAQALQDMRRIGRGKFTRDRLEMAFRDGLPVAIWRFGAPDWEVGRVLKSRTYDFQFQAEAVEQVMVYKHDVKVQCLPDALEAVRRACRYDKRVLVQGLGASKDRKDRYRPTDEQLLDLKKTGRSARWIFRDGTMIEGRLHAFGRWDLDLSVDGEAMATLFFHALHSSTDKGLAPGH